MRTCMEQLKTLRTLHLNRMYQRRLTQAQRFALCMTWRPVSETPLGKTRRHPLTKRSNTDSTTNFSIPKNLSKQEKSCKIPLKIIFAMPWMESMAQTQNKA